MGRPAVRDDEDDSLLDPNDAESVPSIHLSTPTRTSRGWKYGWIFPLPDSGLEKLIAYCIISRIHFSLGRSTDGRGRCLRIFEIRAGLC